MNTRILVLTLLFSLSISSQSKSVDDRNSTRKDSLIAELQKLHDMDHINGFGTAIVNEEGLLFTHGTGFSNTKTKSAYNDQTIQNIGSVSKTFIGLALMKAQETGKLSLDDPVNKYLPFKVQNPTYPDLPITMRHLATHTSTILDTKYYDKKAYVLKEESHENKHISGVSETFNPPSSNMSLLAFLEKFLSPDGKWYQDDGFVERKPGEIFEYSNIGATLAAAVLEIATGKSFNEFTKEHLLEPLNMSSSGWSFDEIDLNKHSMLYASPKKELPLYSLVTYPDGGLITSVRELGLYLVELINGYSGQGSILNEASYKELFTEQLEASNFLERDEENDYDDEYNSGIFIGFTPRGYIGHTGGDPGIATYMFFNPETKTGRIIMINTSIVNSGGVDQFYAIWNTLGKYESLLNKEE